MAEATEGCGDCWDKAGFLRKRANRGLQVPALQAGGPYTLPEPLYRLALRSMFKEWFSTARMRDTLTGTLMVPHMRLVIRTAIPMARAAGFRPSACSRSPCA